MRRKTFEIDQTEDGWWVASTPVVDRDRDRIFPMGLDVSRYEKNPVLIWAHDYRSPYSIIGRAAEMRLSDEDFRVRPEWREPASDTDPMHIIRSLIDNGLARAMSIGFSPIEWKENEFGGKDFTKAEILEISVTPIPANQEALRVAAKAFDGDGEHDTIALKPYPNEHACRLREPGDFEEGSFRRTTREHEGKEYSVIMGRLQGQDTMTEQAYRYDKDTWTADQARSHCSSHDGRFEAAQRAASAVGVPTGHGWEYKEGDTATIAIDGETWTATLYEVAENTWVLERGDTPGGNIPENHKAETQGDQGQAEHEGPPSNQDTNADAPEVNNDDDNERPQDLEELLTAINDFLSEVQEALQ